MSIETFKAQLDAFGNSLGVPDVTPDAEGYCAMSFDDLMVHLQYDAEDDRIVAFSKLGEIDADRRESILALLLGANLFWQGTKGATIAVEPLSDIVFIQTWTSAAGHDDGAFRTWIGGFVDIADYWKRRLADANEGKPFDDGDLPPEGRDDGEAIQFHA